MTAMKTELEKALTGLMDAHHRFLLTQQWAHVDFLEEQIDTLNQEIAQRLEAMAPLSSEPPEPPTAGDGGEPHPPAIGLLAQTDGEEQTPLTWPQAVTLLDTIPGVDSTIAQVMLAELGLDMRQFPSAAALSAWAGLAPGNHQSGGIHYATRIRPGNRALRTILVQAAWATARTKHTYLASLYHRLARRRGKKRAIIAVAHSILVRAYHMLVRRQPYHELGADYFDPRSKDQKAHWFTRQLEKLGFAVSLELLPEVQPASP